MYSFILGFQRLVWCPKWTPASSNSFMVMLANEPPYLDCIRRLAPRITFPQTRPVDAGAGKFVLHSRDVACYVSNLEKLNGDVASNVSTHHRFENWKRLRAPFWPYFLRSFLRESRLRKPSDFSFLRNSMLNCNSARAIPSFTAPACPLTPPPETLATTLKFAAVSLEISGWRASLRCASVTKYLSNGRPFTENWPSPGRKNTRATLDLRRPVP